MLGWVEIALPYNYIGMPFSCNWYESEFMGFVKKIGSIKAYENILDFKLCYHGESKAICYTARGHILLAS